jgi:hypothetical protein
MKIILRKRSQEADMFAPPVVKPKAGTAAPANSASRLRRSAGLLSAERVNEQALGPAASARMSARTGLQKAEWEFAKIPIHPLEGGDWAQKQPRAPVSRSQYAPGGACQQCDEQHGDPQQRAAVSSSTENAPRAQPQETPHTPAKPKPPVTPPGATRRPGAKSPAPPAATITGATVATAPGARTRTTIGVGEEVTLTYSAGSADWATTAGRLSAVRGVSVTLTAPDAAGQVTVTAGTAKISYTAIAPNIVLMERFPDTGISHTKDRPDSGIQTRPYLGPDTVNFYNIKYHEVNVGAMASGVYKPFDGIGHDLHPKTIRMFDDVVAGMGTRTRGKDTVCSGDPATPAPFETGSILYIIPYEYQVGDGPFRRFAYATQMCLYNAANSALYAYKAGAKGLTNVGSPTSNPEMCDTP